MTEPISFQKKIIGFLDAFIRLAVGLLVVVIGGSVAIFAAYISFSSWTSGNRYEVYSGCQVRRMEAHVSDNLGNIHLDYCMAAQGYVRTGGCSSDLILLPGCFVHRWWNWSW